MTMYHVLWELVHVFFEQPGVLAPEVVAMTDSRPQAPSPPCRPRVPRRGLHHLLRPGRRGDRGAVARRRPRAWWTPAQGEEEVSVALVAAGVGDTILVHAGEAIAVLDGDLGG